MKIIIKAMLPLLGIVVLLTACGAVTALPRTKPTETVTASIKAHTLITWTPTDTPAPTITSTFTPLRPTRTPAPSASPTLRADQRAYIDPAGWYEVFFPVSLKPGKKPNVFSSEQGETLEIGYLPDLGYSDVCLWLANVGLRPQQGIIDGASHNSICSVSIMKTPVPTYKTLYTIYLNPRADPEHRFVYVKTGGDVTISEYTGNGVFFSWLKPISLTSAESSPTAAEAAFWKNAPPMPSNISVSEYPSGPASENDVLYHRLPSEFQFHTPTSNETTIKDLGYNFNEGGWLIYGNGDPVMHGPARISKVYTFSTASGPVNAFEARVWSDHVVNDYWIQNNEISLLWNNSLIDFMNTDEAFPILYKGGPLWARVTKDHGSLIQIANRSGHVLFTFAAQYNPGFQFRARNGHWILESNNFVIRDGEILNTKWGVPQMFELGWVQSSLIYFFRKGSKIGISYGGRILPLQYDDIARGLCCGPRVDNPFIGDSFMRFVAKHGEGWYYVVLKFK